MTIMLKGFVKRGFTKKAIKKKKIQTCQLNAQGFLLNMTITLQIKN